LKHLPFALLLIGCAEGIAPEVDADMEALIYGADNRMEYYQIPSQYRPTADAVALQIDDSMLTQRANGTWDVNTRYSFRDWVNLCSSEPFRTQPAPGDCSAFLVGDDTIATAGHCISTSSCRSAAFAFGFRLDAPGVTRTNLAEDDVYFCDRVIARQTGDADWALVQLDRPVTGYTPLPVRGSGTVSTGAPLVLMGYPYGIPLKVAGGATVKQNNDPDYFSANLDSYGGNSGSPVFNATTGVVEGILVRGNNDFVRRGSCYVSQTCPDSGCPGYEDVTRATEFASQIP
jgi:hypothetical protein